MATCPRCGTDLVRGLTAAHKVCADCPSCGGRLVTLPVLKDGLGPMGSATLARAARAASKAGCRCPTCGNAMGLLTVEVGARKIEIDVCAMCLSVWCDRGEFETLVPNRESRKDGASLRDVARRASPEARERLAKAMLDDIPEAFDEPSDFSVEDVVLDIARLVVGAPTLWRTVRPVTPIFAILLTLALSVAQPVAYYAWHASETLRLFGRGRRFWVLDDAMVKSGGFELPSSPWSPLTYPFLQMDGSSALMLSFVLFPAFTVCERKAGHARFLVVVGCLWLVSLVAHAAQVACDQRASACLCGIGPIALGVMAYLRQAYPDLRFHWIRGCDVASIYFFLTTLIVLLERGLGCLHAESYSFALFALVGCGVVGAWLGRRKARREGV